MTEITLDEQTAKLEAYEKGFLAVHLMNTGVVLGLFEKLSMFEDGISPDALASELGLHEPYVRLWCQTAYHFEILDCDEDGRFRLAPHMGTLLTDTENPYYFGYRARFMVSHWAELLKSHPEYYRSGDTHYWDALGHEFSKDAKALTSHIVPVAYRFMIIPSIPELKERLDAGIKVLDVGCGVGHLMVQLAKDFPKCRFIGIEIDRFAVEDAQKYIADNGVQDKASTLLVDAASMNYDGEFDLVNMAIVLHEIRASSRQRSVANCYRALKDSGEIVIFDFAYPERLEDFRKPEYATGIKDQFYEVTWGSQHLPLSARHELLLEVGFKNPTTIPLFGGPVEVTYAKK
jgi:SAM-dependent methyltransferase